MKNVSEGSGHDSENLEIEVNELTWSVHHATLKKRKVSHFLKEAFRLYTNMVDKILKSGVMNRLFRQFDFFSVSDRDSMSPRSSNLKKTRDKPVRCGKKVDMFGDVTWDYGY